VKPASGHVVSRRAIDSIGVTVLTLSNGVEVWLKPTDFKNDQVLLNAYARGGSSTSPDASYFDTALSASLVNLAGVGGMQAPEIASLLAGKVVSLSPFIDTSVHGIRGGSRPQDLEAAFQLLYLTFTAPNGDKAALDLLKRQLNSLIVNRQQNPGAVFADRVRALNTGNSRYVRPITPEALGAVKLDVMRQAYRDRFANAADFMVDRYDADIMFVPMERSVLDTQHSHAVVATMLRAQRATVLKGKYTSGQLLSLMSRFDFAVGMRLHFLIFAALAGTPFVALPYAGKVAGFLEDLGLPAPPLNLVNPGRLIAHIDESWDRRRATRAKLEKAVPPLQERAQQTHRILVELLKKGKLRLASPQAA